MEPLEYISASCALNVPIRCIFFKFCLMALDVSFVFTRKLVEMKFRLQKTPAVFSGRVSSVCVTPFLRPPLMDNELEFEIKALRIKRLG